MKTTLTKQELKDEIIKNVNKNISKAWLKQLYKIIMVISKYEKSLKGGDKTTDEDLVRLCAFNRSVNSGEKILGYSNTLISSYELAERRKNK